jgi:catechol 2,3-dioxygenase-like lactoylglutathione lyase family enzyme
MPVYHVGRLIDHVHLRVADLDASKRFYRAILEALGKTIGGEDERHLQADELWIDAAGDDPVSRLHLAFQAADKDAVSRFHAAGLAAGGRDNGAPGPRDYHPGYYAAFLLDPDGNNIEAVVHAQSVKRSAASVELRL